MKYYMRNLSENKLFEFLKLIASERAFIDPNTIKFNKIEEEE
jgi:hypothetical protein